MLLQPNLYYCTYWKQYFTQISLQTLCYISFKIVGVHPNEAKTWDSDVESTLKGLLSNAECVAVGQCGLDFTKNLSEPDEQKEVLSKQVDAVS